MHVKRNSVLIWTAVICASLLIGGFGGGFVAKSIRTHQKEQNSRERFELQTSVLRQMGTLEVGDTLQDHAFEDLNLKPVQLGEIVTRTTIISVFDPGCDACLEEFSTFQRVLTPVALEGQVVFISGGNPRYIAELVASTGLASHVLYDHHSAWLGSYRILTFPFNLIVDSNLVVKQIVVGAISEEELKSTGIEVLQGN